VAEFIGRRAAGSGKDGAMDRGKYTILNLKDVCRRHGVSREDLKARSGVDANRVDRLFDEPEEGAYDYPVIERIRDAMPEPARRDLSVQKLVFSPF
jgi:hypothetical protein